MTEEQFDELLKEMREENAEPEQIAAARDCVWRQITGSTSLACAEFRPEFTEYLAGRLTDSRRLLIDDHLGRCGECRRALAEVKGEGQVVSIAKGRRFLNYGWTRWAVAAGVVVVGLYAARGRIDSALAPSGPRATVISVSGALYRLPQSILQPGATLADQDVVRTTAGSRAILRLADGSRVELNQRTELAVQAAWSGATIRLDRGDIIVQAAKQRRGYLRVVARDSIASVKGTVFAVSSGAAGSLVSVVEGSVAVSQPGVERTLTAGKHSATNSSLDRVEVRQAIAWSSDVEKYYALLAEFAGIEKQLTELTSPAVRTQARLLQYLPAGTMVYFAIPNLDGAIRQALRLVEQRARDNAALNEWWSSDHGQELKQSLDRVQAVTPLLGEEVVFVMVTDPAHKGRHIPVVLSQIQAGRQDALRQALDRLIENHPERIPYRISQDLLLISDSGANVAFMASQLGAGSSSPFASEIARRYQNGVGWLVGLDFAMFGGELEKQPEARLLGLLNMRYVFFEQRSGGGRDENEATLAFQGARTGIASWLATPGSAGSTEYVSSEAVAAFSASTRDPRQALDELLFSATNFASEIRKFEVDTGVNLSADVAASLGTDFTFAIERPTLPIPGWVAALEVVRPAAFDDSVRRLVDAYNRHLTPAQSDHKATLAQEDVNGRSWISLRTGLSPLSLHWTYDRGYLIASSDRALATRAIAIRQSGSSLIRSANFQQRFPSTGGMHHSGFFWLNTNGILAELSGLVQSPALKSLMGSRDPLLVVLDGETERIRAGSRSRLTSLILDAMLVHGAGENRKIDN
jgi:hypothetical protein